MSWIFGFAGPSLSRTDRERLVALHEDPLFCSESPTHYIAVGGPADTGLYDVFPSTPERAWAVVGLGIQCREEACTFLDKGAWRSLLEQPSPRLEDLDGHFVALRWQPGRLDAFTDGLGTRTLYLMEWTGGLAFSTRLDWLARLRGHVTLNVEAFGTHWLTFNQLSTTALLHDIHRLGPGGRLTWTPHRLETTTHPWMPDVAVTDPSGEAFARTLFALTHPKTPDARPVSLGLSGGLDSRLLLAFQPGDPPINTHVFGPADHPDVQLAHRIAHEEGVTLHHYHAPIPEVDACLALLRSQVAQTQAVSAASSVLGLRYYPRLHARRCIMMDGGLGEAARRQFMNRLLRRGRAALHSRNPAAILPHLRVPRADIFNRETLAAMERGVQADIEMLLAALPDPAVLGEETWLDLLGVRTRLPNFFGFEQNRLDGVLPNYMPFAQPSLLQAVFHTPVALRRNGRLFRRLIRSRQPTLARYPLVKGAVSYPFRLPTLPAYAWTKLKAQLGKGYTDTRRLHFLDIVKPFVLDSLHAQSVRAESLYDVPRLVQLVEGFYGGATERAAQVDWWLAFEMWRRVVGF